MSYGIFTGMVGHSGSWIMGPFVKRDKSSKSNITKKGNNVLAKEEEVDDEA